MSHRTFDLTDNDEFYLRAALAEAEAQRLKDADECNDGASQARQDRAMARAFAKLAKKMKV